MLRFLSKRLTYLENRNISYKKDSELRVEIVIQRWLEIEENWVEFGRFVAVL